MSQYHTHEAWRRRQTERRRDPKPPPALGVFYHCALMPGWEPIVREQLDLLRHVGLMQAHACCLGSFKDAATVYGWAVERGIDLAIEYFSNDLGEYEHPTLCRLWRAARANPESAYLYFHTKGASFPGCPVKRRWRRIMQRYVIADWRPNMVLLSSYDIVGANWQALRDFPHYQGNFWMARGDWLANLDDPSAHRAGGQHIQFAGQPWNRMHAELWLGSQPWHEMCSHVGQDLTWWHSLGGSDGVAWDVPAFSYESYDP